MGQKVCVGAPLDPLPSGPGKGSGKLEPCIPFFVERIGQDPDITLSERQSALQDAHKVEGSPGGVDAALRRRGFTYKKRLIAQERDKPEVRTARHDGLRRQKTMRKQPQRLVFIDETGAPPNMTRTRGRRLKGDRLFGTAPFRRSRNRTLIAGLACEGLIAPWVISGAMNRDAFDTYIEKVLVPDPGTVVILDNLAPHKSARAAESLKKNGGWFLFLPPLQP